MRLQRLLPLPCGWVSLLQVASGPIVQLLQAGREGRGAAVGRRATHHVRRPPVSL